MSESVKTSRSTLGSRWRNFQASGAVGAMGIAAAFFVTVTLILMLRQDVIPYRPGQYVGHNITSRVDFNFPDADELARLRELARDDEPRVYRATGGDYWGALQDELMTLPDRTYQRQPAELPEELRSLLDPGDLSALDRIHDRDRQAFNQEVKAFVARVRQQLTVGGSPLVILPMDQRQEELNRIAPIDQTFVRHVTLYPPKPQATAISSGAAGTSGGGAAQTVSPELARRVNVATETYAAPLPPEVVAQLQNLAEMFPLSVKPAMVQLTASFLSHHPTHTLDLEATKMAQDQAATEVPPSEAMQHYPHDTVVVSRGTISDRDWQLLRTENDEFLQTQEAGRLKPLAGTGLMVFVLTGILGAYIWRFQPRVVRNRLRAAVLAGLLVAMLLISALSGMTSGSLYLLGVAPTILTAIVLTIAYDQRFSMGIAGIEAALATCALNQGVGFFIVLMTGVLVACFMLGDVRTRSKLIEVGGVSAVGMMIVTFATGLTSLEAMDQITRNALYAGLAGLAAGFVTLGILPFIEKLFRITTSMTLLELADVMQPLLRRLSFEAPGTYNHSLQVAALAEAAAEAIGANALACRVGAYYHDIGKINKADYFTENQIGQAANRHLNLSPNVSLMIIIGHVKDGMELARQYKLPPTILQFIQQHHGTTLVEYFYSEACKQTASGAGKVPETEFRYPGPKPKSRETAILMMADCCESACRAMTQINGERIESLVHDLVLRRLHDGQFSECDLTMRDVDRIERSLMKTLMGIYHGRVAYPSMNNPGQSAGSSGAGGTGQQSPPTMKLA